MALKYVDGNVLTYDFESKTALLLHNEEILILLENYKITSIEQGQNNDLYLQENEINSFDVSKKYVCQANTLLLQNGQRQDRLIQSVYYKIKQIFQTNNILTDIISKPLHQCCSSSTGVVDSNACLSEEWTPKIKTCFKNWSNILERNIRAPSAGEMLSWAFGEGQRIDSVSNTMSSALKKYNENFQNLNTHEMKIDYNINSLSKITANITRYEQQLHTSNLISSVLSQQNFKRLFNSLKMSNHLKELEYILSKAGIDQLLVNLNNALLNINPMCVIRDNLCVTHRYLTQAADRGSVLLHKVSSELTRSLTAITTCLPRLGKISWEISDLNKQKFSILNKTLISGNLSVPIELLSNITYLNSTMRNLKKSETTLTDFLIFSLEEEGEEKFQLFCLNTTLFNLNNEYRKCAQNEILDLPTSNWILKNDFGEFSHFI